jgi:RND family efflux transporter MFP subunit
MRFVIAGAGVGLFVISVALFSSCSRREVSAKTTEDSAMATVGTVAVTSHALAQHLTVSSELVPFQQIDVYAKEAGYVKTLLVDYGTHVKQGQLMATLEIPELEAQLQQDQAAIHAQADEIVRASHDVERVKAQHDVLRLQYERLKAVSQTKPGLVAQQEVDDAQGKDLASESQLEAAQGAYEAAKSQLVMAQAKLTHDQALYDYSKITAPFAGVVTQRFANLGALMQAGTTSTQATPLVRLSEEDVYRLVIPVPESYVRYIRIGDPVGVRVSSLNKDFTGKVARFAVELNDSTRTMHTEVDVKNTDSSMVPGLYAEAVLTFNDKPTALAIPLQAINRSGEATSVSIVDQAGRVAERKVELGIQTANYAEVVSGLHAGEQVIVSDRSGLKPGQQVKAQPVQAMVYEGAEQ